MGLRLFSFSTAGLGHRIFAALPILCIQGFKGREKWISLAIPDRKYISIKAFLTENMVSFKEVWPWNEFERFVVLFSNIRLKGEVNCFIREILEVFYLLSAFIGM